MAAHTHLVHGLVVHSDLPLAAARRIGVGGASVPDVVICVEKGAAPPATPVAATYTVSGGGPEWRIDFAGTATAIVRSDDPLVDVQVAAGVAPELVSVLVSGPILCLAALARGHHLLHSSAVATGSASEASAVGWVGGAGSGKSTLARLMVGAGWSVFSDDALRVDLGHSSESDESAAAHRGTLASRLRSATPVGLSQVTSVSADGRLLVDDHATDVAATAELTALISPLLSPSFTSARVERLPVLQATALLSAAWPLRGVRDPAALSSRLRWAAALATRVPVHILELPWTGAPWDEGDRQRLRDLVATVAVSR